MFLPTQNAFRGAKGPDEGGRHARNTNDLRKSGTHGGGLRTWMFARMKPLKLSKKPQGGHYIKKNKTTHLGVPPPLPVLQLEVDKVDKSRDYLLSLLLLPILSPYLHPSPCRGQSPAVTVAVTPGAAAQPVPSEQRPGSLDPVRLAGAQHEADD